MKTMSFLLASSLALVSLASGCAAPDDATADNGGADEMNEANAFVPPKTCGDAKWNEAFTHYKKAVELSKARAKETSCTGEAFLSTIVEEAHVAADTCDDFSVIIKDSPFAEQLRKEMEQTLDLDVITKKVKTKDWSGLADAFKDGVTFFDNDGGVLGNRGEILLADGVVTAVITEHAFAEDGKVVDTEQVGSYEIGERQADGSIEIILEVNATGGPTEKKVFKLTKELRLELGERRWLSTPSECET